MQAVKTAGEMVSYPRVITVAKKQDRIDVGLYRIVVWIGW